MRRLRIGVDARELLGARTGAGRYLAELMSRWSGRPDSGTREFVLYSPEALAGAWPGTVLRILGGGRGALWEQTTLGAAVRQDDLDVFFAPAYTAPLWLKVPLAVTIHDVSFSRHPEWFRFREGRRRHLLTRAAARRADAVITDSEFSRREIVALYGISSHKVRVIPIGVTAHRGQAVAREPLVLYAGSIFNRRRVPDIITAFAAAARSVPAARLIITGDNRTWPVQDLAAAAAASGAADQITLRNYVSDEELASLYARASAFIFLSEYEGFGLTPLEALAAGVPVVMLDTQVAREIQGDAAIFVAAGDIAAAADALTLLLTSKDAAAAQLERSTAVLARYSWDHAALQTLTVLEGIARR